jgi:hypothetical protein
MAHTDITLIDSGGTLVPSADSVSVVKGDTVSFSTSDGTPAFAFFSPDAISVLSPRPASPFPIAAGKKAEFTFSSSAAGAYSAFFAIKSGPAPGKFPADHSAALRLEVDTSVSPPFPGPGDDMGTGHGG